MAEGDKPEWTCPTWRSLNLESSDFALDTLNVSFHEGLELRLKLVLVDPWVESWEISFEVVDRLYMNTVFNSSEDQEPADIGWTEGIGRALAIGVGDGTISFVSARAYIEHVGPTDVHPGLSGTAPSSSSLDMGHDVESP